MDLDIVTSLDALKGTGLHVARSKVVDSAEDAIAFAERRIAPDPRLVPIVLRTLPDGADTHVVATEPLEDEAAIRRAYARISGERGRRVMAQTATERGTDMIVVGETDEAHGRTISASAGSAPVQRLVPLGEAGAAALATHIHGAWHRAPDHKQTRLLEHLFLHLSDLFEQTPELRSFRAVVRLHENTYTVTEAVLTTTRPLHIAHRLERHAHDRKSRLVH